MKIGSISLLLLLFILSFSIALMVYALCTQKDSHALLGLCGILTSLVLFILYKTFASSAHCPLCRGHVLRGSGAQRNRRARRSLGSHRLRVARDIIFTNSFVCPYCNEQTLCIVRARRPM